MRERVCLFVCLQGRSWGEDGKIQENEVGWRRERDEREPTSASSTAGTIATSCFQRGHAEKNKETERERKREIEGEKEPQNVLCFTKPHLVPSPFLRFHFLPS